jgi:hypothetical protein
MDATKSAGWTAPVTPRCPCVLVAMLSIVKRLNNRFYLVSFGTPDFAPKMASNTVFYASAPS